MAQRNTGRVFGALALLAVFLPLSTLAGCKLFNKEKKQFGEDCASDEDCDSAECGTYGSMCTKGCNLDKDCGSGYVCRARDGGRPGDVCAKPTGVPTGQSCNNAAECQSGNCLKPVGQQDAMGFCSTHCDTEADCPDNYKTCLSISDSGALKFCLPGGGGGAAIPGTPEPPKFVAPRPIAKPVPTATTTTTTTTTTTPTPTSTGTGFIKPTATASASAAPTTSASTTAPATSATVTTTGTKTRPKIILAPKK